MLNGYLTTVGTPAPIVALLNREIVKALHTPEIRQSLEDGGAESVGSTPEEFGAYFKREVEKYAKVIKAAGAQVD